MCFSNTITWKKCGHFVIRREYCEEALGKQPVAYCPTAYTPIYTDVDESDGVCPDRQKHPPAPGQSSFSAWSGITATSGEGNDRFRKERELREARNEATMISSHSGGMLTQDGSSNLTEKPATSPTGQQRVESARDPVAAARSDSPPQDQRLATKQDSDHSDPAIILQQAAATANLPQPIRDAVNATFAENSSERPLHPELEARLIDEVTEQVIRNLHLVDVSGKSPSPVHLAPSLQLTEKSSGPDQDTTAVQSEVSYSVLDPADEKRMIERVTERVIENLHLVNLTSPGKDSDIRQVSTPSTELETSIDEHELAVPGASSHVDGLMMGSDEDADSLTIIGSVASDLSGITLQGHAVSDQIVESLVDLLFPLQDLSSLHETASGDAEIDYQDLRERICHAVIEYGRKLKIEACTKAESVAGSLIRSKTLATRIAYATTDRLHAFGTIAKQIQYEPSRAPESDDENEYSELPDDYSSQMEQDFVSLRAFLQESCAYDDFQLRRLELINRPYQLRIENILRAATLPASVSSTVLATELSWVPPKLFHVVKQHQESLTDNLKGWIEDDLMRERWDWWPLAARHHGVAAGCQRLSWTSPSGTPRYFDIPPQQVSELMTVFASAPQYLSNDGGSSCTTNRSKDASSYNALEPCQNLSPASRHVQKSNDRSGPHQTQHNAPVTAGKSKLPVPNILYFSVQSGDRFDIVELKEDQMCTDRQFFATLKSEYRRLKRRGRWMSMWQYDHCEFAMFSKYACDTCAFVAVDYPPASDLNYNYAPRPIAPSPPHGPITKHEFRDRFYKSCEDCHSWHWHRRKMLRFKLVDRDAVDRLPKRKAAIDLADGKREEFWGLIARERRSFARVVAICMLWNIVSVIFFFLWIFKWNHPADLQNAIVPMTVTLAITGLYVCMIYEDREGNK